ncbi:hypothetical protein [Bradyrhizobium sp. USDA 336]|uniref:hypothetical protein n=1 Tax=Bradyrhizobium sp. USDA 336 TaxID=3156311 RepID=UPI00384D2E68
MRYEPTDRIAGGKIDRFTYVSVPDAQAAIAAVQAGCHQAILHGASQVDYLKAIVTNPKYFRPSSLVACGMPMENDANSGWFTPGLNYAKAKQLLKEGGDDGRPDQLAYQ